MKGMHRIAMTRIKNIPLHLYVKHLVHYLQEVQRERQKLQATIYDLESKLSQQETEMYNQALDNGHILESRDASQNQLIAYTAEIQVHPNYVIWQYGWQSLQDHVDIPIKL